MTIVLVALALFALPLSAQEPVGAFFLDSSTDPLTDEGRHLAFTRALESSGFGEATLVFRCEGDRLRVMIGAGQFLNVRTAGLSPGHVPVQWRFDQEPASAEVNWGPSTTGTAAFAPDEVAREVAIGARVATRMVTRLKDFQSTPVTLTFSMDGASTVLSRLPCAPDA